MIKVTDLTFAYGSGPVFNRASFYIGRCRKVGLVGPNGAGKSTLFKLLTGQEVSQGGRLEVAGRVGFVPQEVTFDPDLEAAPTIREYLDPEGKRKPHELTRLLAGLEASDLDLAGKPTKLSGGQKTKLALARALLSEPDILLLDEPTNFMDQAGKRFVMDFLARYPHTLIVVSHDLELLGPHIDEVHFVNEQSRQLDVYKGDYSQFLKLKKARDEWLTRQITAKQKHIKKMEKALPRLYQFTSKKGVRARVRQQQRIEREKAALPPLPHQRKNFSFNLPVPALSGELPVRFLGVSKAYGAHQVLNRLDFSVYRREKFLLLGPNGAGKSTIIKLIMGGAEPDAGSVELGTNLQVGYYSQELENFNPRERLLDLVIRTGKVDQGRARGFLDKFLFGRDKVHQIIATLSGGEKTRLAVALLLLAPHNLLVLDEPTTYLDPLSQRLVLEALKEYQGTLVLVSHVEDFVRELAPDRALLMPEGRTVLWDEKYLAKVGQV